MIWQKKCHHNKQRCYVTLTISTLLHRESYNKGYNILFMTFHYDKHITAWKQSLLFLSNTTPPFLSHNKHNLTTRNISKPETVFINVIYTWSKTPNQPMAYFWVQLRAVASYLVLSVLYMWAISGTRGSSGFGSVSSEQMESSTLEMVSAGLHCSFRISRQMLPLLLILGWKTLVLNATLGGLKG